MSANGGFGGFGGFGGTNITGLGSFLGADDTGGYDPATTQGLALTAESLRHLAGDDDASSGHEIVPGDDASFARLASWVRGSLYLSEFLSGTSWEQEAPQAGSPATLEIDQRAWLTVKRPENELLARQCRLVREYAVLRDERANEIVSQLGFPTAYFSMILGLHAAEHKHTFELITATQVVAAHTAMSLKTRLAVRRPDQIDGRILPMIPTPGHPAFPSAHATEAYAVATVLQKLSEQWRSFADFEKRAKLLVALAERIAVNRTVAGVHYPIDSWAGAALGQCVGRAVLGRCAVAVTGQKLEYLPEDKDFFNVEFQDKAKAEAAGLSSVEEESNVAAASPAFTWLWQQAMKERQRS